MACRNIRRSFKIPKKPAGAKHFFIFSIEVTVTRSFVPSLAHFSGAPPGEGKTKIRDQNDTGNSRLIFCLPVAPDSHFAKFVKKGRLYTAFKYPGIFGQIVTPSCHLDFAEGEELRALIEGAGKRPVQIHMEWGSYDYRDASGGDDWRKNNRNFSQLLKEKGFAVTTAEISPGFGWTRWRTRTGPILEEFYRAAKSLK